MSIVLQLGQIVTLLPEVCTTNPRLRDLMAARLSGRRDQLVALRLSSDPPSALTREVERTETNMINSIFYHCLPTRPLSSDKGCATVEEARLHYYKPWNKLKT